MFGLISSNLLVMILAVGPVCGERYEDIISKEAAIHSVDTNLIEAVIYLESRCHPRARSRANAIGLMQVLPSTASFLLKRKVTALELYNPKFNIKTGVLLLGRLLKRYEGRVDMTLAAYNAGTGSVKKWIAKVPKPSKKRFLELIRFPSTRNYVRAAMRRIKERRTNNN